MAKTKKDTAVRFLAGAAPRATLLGLLAFPTSLDGKDAEFTRLYMVSPDKWTHREFPSDLVSLVFEDGPNGKCWWLLGKRGDVHAVRPTGVTVERISDAGTGRGKYGYLSRLGLFQGRLFACGFSRQVYERTDEGWVHVDQGILLDAAQMDYGFNDLTAAPDGTICAVGDEGEIAIRSGAQWVLVDSPTNEHLHAVTTDSAGRFIAAGARGTVLRGSSAGFEVLCSGGSFGETVWDVEEYMGEVIVSATPGLFAVRNDALVPFDRPKSPSHVGYRLVLVGDVLWSVGTHQVFCLQGGSWTEWVCPDNKP